MVTSLENEDSSTDSINCTVAEDGNRIRTIGRGTSLVCGGEQGTHVSSGRGSSTSTCSGRGGHLYWI